MLWMKVRDLLTLAISDQDYPRRISARSEQVEKLKRSISAKGWIEECKLGIVNGKLAAGLLRRQALRELLNEGAIKDDMMVSVEVMVTMLVHSTVPVLPDKRLI